MGRPELLAGAVLSLALAGCGIGGGGVVTAPKVPPLPSNAANPAVLPRGHLDLRLSGAIDERVTSADVGVCNTQGGVMEVDLRNLAGGTVPVELLSVRGPVDVPGPYPLADGANFFPVVDAPTPSPPRHGPLGVTLTPQRAKPDQWVSKPGKGSISVNEDLLSGTLDVALDGPRGGVHLSGTWECLALSSGGHPGSGPITGPSPATTSSGTPTMVPAR